MSKTKNCAQCGAEFQCLHNAECWCMSVKISKENLKLLQEKFDNCLCPECLKTYEEPKSDLRIP